MPNQEPPVPQTADRPHRRSRGRRAGVLGALFVVVLLVAGCSTNQTPKNYNGTVQKDFLKGCTLQTGNLTEDDAAGLDQRIGTKQQISDWCRCTYKAIVKQVDYGDFKAVNSELTDVSGDFSKLENKDAKKAWKQITTIQADCQSKAGGSGESTPTTTAETTTTTEAKGG